MADKRSTDSQDVPGPVKKKQKSGSQKRREKETKKLDDLLKRVKPMSSFFQPTSEGKGL